MRAHTLKNNMAMASEGNNHMERGSISLVLPIYNEEENIGPLLEEIRSALAPLEREYEVIAIDDGSTDESLKVLSQAIDQYPELKVVEFRKNFGQTAAFSAGFDLARGEWVVTMDADLQNDPKDISKLLEKAEEGFDIVSGWRVKRKDGFIMRKIPSKIANWLIRKITGVHIHDYGCSLKVYHRDVAKSVWLYGELHRFIPAVASGIGVKVTELAVNHRARTAGTSKYTGLIKTISRSTKVFLDLATVRFILSYSTRPLHIFGTLGLLSSLAGVGIGTYLTIDKFVFQANLAERPLLMLAVLLLLLGVQFITFGLLGEMLVRVYHEAQNKPIYNVRRVIEIERSANT